MKKIIYVAVIFLLCFMCINNVSAMSGRLEKLDYIYNTYNTNGSSSYTRNSSYKLFVDDILSYCITPGVLFREGEGYYEGVYDGLTSEQLKRIELINYYGYGFFYHTTSEYYLATQEMIHNVLGYTTIYNEGKYSVDDKKRDIEYFVNRHDLSPTIDDDIYVVPGVVSYFVDDNSTLGEFVIETSSNIVYGIDANKLVVKLMNDEDGYIRFYKGNDIPNKFYIKDDSQIVATFGLKKELRKEIRVHKDQVGKIEVNDIDRATLEGIGGSVYNLLDSDNNILETKSTNEYGYLMFDNYYEYGSYYVVEESLIDYEKTNERYYVDLDSDLSTAWFYHGNLGSIDILNIDEFGNRLNGTFEIFCDLGNVGDGSDLAIGSYSVKQLTAQDGYYMDNNTYNVRITKNNLNQEVTVVNELIKGSIDVKIIGEDDEEISGKYIIYNEDNDDLANEDLVPGTYYVKQTETLDKYLISQEIYEINITLDDLNQELIITNELKKGSITIKNIDEVGNELNGVFEILDINNNVVNQNDLLPGVYYIHQIDVEDGYQIDDNTYEINITLDDLDKEIIIINNKILSIIPKTSGYDYSFIVLFLLIGIVFKRIKYSL